MRIAITRGLVLRADACGVSFQICETFCQIGMLQRQEIEASDEQRNPRMSYVTSHEYCPGKQVDRRACQSYGSIAPRCARRTPDNIRPAQVKPNSLDL